MNLREDNVVAQVAHMVAYVLTSAASWHNEQPLLTYSVPAELQDSCAPGQLVAIPYGDRLAQGIVWRIASGQEDDVLDVEDEGEYKLRPISAILDVEPVLLPHQRALAEWIAEYYVAPLAQTAFMMLPPGLTQRSQVVLHLAKSTEVEVGDGSDSHSQPRCGYKP